MSDIDQMSFRSDKPYRRIGVLMGGYSSENKISIKSGEAVSRALKDAHFDVVDIIILEMNLEKIKDQILQTGIDIAFIALHGCLGEDGTIQALLEDAGIAYTGSGVIASQTAFDKFETQNLLKKSNIIVPPYVNLNKEEGSSAGQKIDALGGFPVVIKPLREGSSFGVVLVKSSDDLSAALESVWQFGNAAIVEKYIKGREFTVGILDQRPLPVVEIKPHREFFDTTSKYEVGETDYIVPAQLPPIVSTTLQSVAFKTHKVIGCVGFSRVDFILSEELIAYALEINTIPGFTNTSLLPKAAAADGIKFHELCIKILDLGYAKKKKK